MKSPFALRRVAGGLFVRRDVLSVLAAGAPALAESSYTPSRAGRCARSRSRPAGTCSSRSTRPTTASRSSASDHGALGPPEPRCRSGSSRSPWRRASDGEVWVVNHLSDSVSVVELSSAAAAARVVRTLLVGDEPRDIVFAGPGRRPRLHHHGAPRPEHARSIRSSPRRAWAAPTSGCSTRTCALVARRRRRSPSSPCSPTRRARSRSTPDGDTRLRRRLPLGQPDHRRHRAARARRRRGRTAARRARRPTLRRTRRPRSASSCSSTARTGSTSSAATWDDPVRFSLPDKDVFAIDATANPPAPDRRAGGPSTPASGTVLFNMVVNPVSGKVYVSNTEARNEDRFEGPAPSPAHGVRGPPPREPHHACSTGGPRVAPRHLNKHIDYSTLLRAGPQRRERGRAWPTPVDMAVTRDGVDALRGRASARARSACSTPRARERHVRARRRRPRSR